MIHKIYNLPLLPVSNTGDEPGEYGVSIEYHEGQEKNPEMARYYAMRMVEKYGLQPPKGTDEYEKF